MVGYRKTLTKAGVIGLISSTVTSFIPYQFCMCGLGFGIPLAVVYPHRGSRWIVEVYSRGETSWFLNLKNVLINIVIWIGLTLIILALRRGIKNRAEGSFNP